MCGDPKVVGWMFGLVCELVSAAVWIGECQPVNISRQAVNKHSLVTRAFLPWNRCWRTWRPSVWRPKAEDCHCQSFNPTSQLLDPGLCHQWPGLRDRIPGWLIVCLSQLAYDFQESTEDVLPTGEPSSLQTNQLHRPVDIQEHECCGEGRPHRCPRRWHGEGGGQPYRADDHRRLIYRAGENREQELSPSRRGREWHTLECARLCVPRLSISSPEHTSYLCQHKGGFPSTTQYFSLSLR